MKLKNPMLAVRDMERTVDFYKKVLGLHVIMDFGANKTLTGGLALQTEETYREFIGADEIAFGGKDFEIYFEEDDFDRFAKRLETLDVEYVHPVVEHAWGQRVVRFYDPDRHIVEVGENMKAVCRRFLEQGLSLIHIFYGDMDMAEKLTWLDREYLSKYDCQEVDSEILLQKPFSEPANREIFYSLSGGESEEDATYLSVNTVAGDGLDGKHYIAFQVLEYALLDAPGAALKQAMTDAGIGQDLLGGYENGILQPYFSVIAKNANKEQLGEFLAVVKGTLRKLADQGIDRKMLLAGINYYEFRYREADFGGAPKGLMYGLQSLDSWLYGGDPLTHLEYEKVFEELKKGVDEGYFESLLRDLLLDNPFEAVITVSPRKNLTAENEAALAKKLSEYKACLLYTSRCV